MATIETNHHEEAGRIKHKVSKRIRQLASADSVGDADSKETILDQLAKLIKRVGIVEQDVIALFDIIFSGSLTSSEKSGIIRDLLVPSPGTVLSTDLIYRIVSQIGIPQKKNPKKDSKRLSNALQLQLLEWLVASIHLFGEDVFKTLNRMLPILFNYLSFEYSRPYLANLIFLTLSNCSTTFKTYKNKQQAHRLVSLKNWHIQLVVDLYLKFPLDEYLQGLLFLFKIINPQLNYDDFSNGSFLEIGSAVQSQVFTYPNHEYLSKLEELESKDSSVWDYPDLKSSSKILARNLEEYSQFDQSIKKRKRHNDHTLPDIDVIELDVTLEERVSLKDLQSVKDLILNFNDLGYIKINEVFKDTGGGFDKLKKLAIVLKIIANSGDQEGMLQKLNYNIRLSLMDDNLSVAELTKLSIGIQSLLKFGAGTLDFTSIRDFVYGRYPISPIVQSRNKRLVDYEELNVKLRFLRYLPVSDFTEFESFLKPTFEFFNDTTGTKAMRARKRELLCIFVDELTSLFRNQINAQGANLPRTLNTISKTLPLFYDNYYTRYHYYESFQEYCVLKIFEFVKSIDIALLNEYFTDDAIVPPPVIVYSLLLRGDPFLSSEVCGYIAHTKLYTYKTDSKRAIQNSYIMDTVNYIWREKALNHEASQTSSEKGFLFHPDFQVSINSLHLFNYSNMVTPPTIGNLFVNPAWAYISAQIVWKLEDENQALNTRHEGPVSKDSISRLSVDHTKKWLDLNYDELRLKVLRELDLLGFKGLADLLFNSLQTLQNRRH